MLARRCHYSTPPSPARPIGAGPRGKPLVRHTGRDPSVPPRTSRTAPASDGRGGWKLDPHPPESGDGVVIARPGGVGLPSPVFPDKLLKAQRFINRQGAPLFRRSRNRILFLLPEGEGGRATRGRMRGHTTGVRRFAAHCSRKPLIRRHTAAPSPSGRRKS